MRITLSVLASDDTVSIATLPLPQVNTLHADIDDVTHKFATSDAKVTSLTSSACHMQAALSACKLELEDCNSCISKLTDSNNAVSTL